VSDLWCLLWCVEKGKLIEDFFLFCGLLVCWKEKNNQRFLDISGAFW